VNSGQTLLGGSGIRANLCGVTSELLCPLDPHIAHCDPEQGSLGR
jgi:hypothetical protein